MKMPSKSTLTTVALTLGAVLLLNQFDATRDLLSGGNRFFK